MGQLHEMVEKQNDIFKIAHGDSLDTFAELMPYLLQRREAARLHHERPNEHTYFLMQNINKDISEILSLF